MKRILVIDDEAKLRTQTAELLRLEDYEVTEGRNGREGVELARRTPPDLIVCDITMPEMNGHRVLDTLRGEIGERVAEVEEERRLHAVRRPGTVRAPLGKDDQLTHRYL